MTTMNAETLATTIAGIFRAHDGRANKESKRFRKWDGKTPYGIHPTWAAMTILTETLSPLAIASIVKRCKRMGLRATAENDTMKGPYLYSDGAGYYSTDYYLIYRYGLITIVG